MKRSVLLRDDRRDERVGGEVGCKPHKVILQNVYAKRFNGVARRGEEARAQLAHDSIRDNLDKTPPQANLLRAALLPKPRRLLIEVDYSF